MLRVWGALCARTCLARYLFNAITSTTTTTMATVHIPHTSDTANYHASFARRHQMKFSSCRTCIQHDTCSCRMKKVLHTVSILCFLFAKRCLCISFHRVNPFLHLIKLHRRVKRHHSVASIPVGINFKVHFTHC